MKKYSTLLILSSALLVSACGDNQILSMGKGYAPYTMERTAGHAPGWVVEKMMPKKDLVVDEPMLKDVETHKEPEAVQAMTPPSPEPALKVDDLYTKALHK